MATFDPYRKWLGIPPKSQPPNHYRLLGIGLFESDPDVISSAADRQMAHVRTFQSGKHSEFSQQILNELSAARICLLDTKKRAEYDAKLLATLKSSKPQPPLPEETQPASSLGDAALTINVAPTIRGISPSATTFPGTTRLSYTVRRKKQKQQQWLIPAAVVLLVLGAIVLLIFFSGRPATKQPQTPVRRSGKPYSKYFLPDNQPRNRPGSGGRRRSPNKTRPSTGDLHSDFGFNVPAQIDVTQDGPFKTPKILGEPGDDNDRTDGRRYARGARHRVQAVTWELKSVKRAIKPLCGGRAPPC